MNKAQECLKRMRDARGMILKDNPFFGHLSMKLELACANCGTACTDGERLFFDPEFAEKLSDIEIQFVLLHEVLHVVLQHCTRASGYIHDIHNIACDIVVNSMILEMWGLNTTQIDGEEPMHLAPDGKEGRLYSAEEVYYMLLADSKENGGGRKFQGKEGSVDRHDIWAGIQNGNVLKDTWNANINQASKQWGDSTGMPQSLRNVMDRIQKQSKVDWKEVLHEFIQHNEYDYSFLPPDRRYNENDFYLPAYNIDLDQEEVNNIWVLIDTSGSISQDVLSEFMLEVIDAIQQVHLKGMVSFFDSEVSTPIPIENEEGFRKIQPVGGGGTSFVRIFSYMKKNLYPNLPKAILILTDGYAIFPPEKDACGVPVLWAIADSDVKKVPFGKCIRLDE